MITFELSAFQTVFSSRAKDLTGRVTPPNATPMTKIQFMVSQCPIANTVPIHAPFHHLHHLHRISTQPPLIRAPTSTPLGRLCQGFRQLCPWMGHPPRSLRSIMTRTVATSHTPAHKTATPIRPCQRRTGVFSTRSGLCSNT